MTKRHLPHLQTCCGPASGVPRRAVLGAAAALAVGAALPGCVATNPATGRRSFTGLYDPEDDVRIGREEHPKILKEFGGAYESPRLNGYVESVGRTLAQHTEFRQFNYRFTILNSPIVNAFALPGGYVYLSRGLIALASSEAEMAGVLAHELGHVNARHTAERLSAAQLAQFGLLGAAILGLPQDFLQVGQSVAGMVIQGYSRQQELESDTLGVRYMSRAGYDPDAMVSFLASLREQAVVDAKVRGLPPGSVDDYNAMATHPRTIDRVKQAQREAAERRPQNPRIGRDDHLNQIDGMLFGDDPSQGLVQGQRFVHPELRFEFSVPEGFVLRNSPSRVVAQNKNGAGIVFDTDRPKSSGSLDRYIRQEWAPKAPLSDLEPLRINGLEAATARFAAQSQRGAVDVRLLAIRGDAGAVFRFLYITPQQQTAALSEDLQRSSYSFRRLSASEAAAIQPMRLLVVPATANESIAALARPLPYGQYNEEWFRVLNDLKPGERIPPNRRIKVIAT